MIQKKPSSSRHTRIFTINDQKNFAQFTGDFNPIHIDPIFSRKTISGKIIVHGINSLLWAIELLVSEEKKIFERMHVKFLKPIFLDTKVKYDWDAKKKVIRLSSEGRDVVLITLISEISQINKITSHGLKIKTITKRKPRTVNFKNLKLNEILPLNFYGDITMAEKLFPSLNLIFGQGVVCQIGSLSEVIGMQLPGLHSLFAQANIVLKKNQNLPKIEIISFDKRFKLIKINCFYQDIEANLDAFFRPNPIKTPLYKTLKADFGNLNFNKSKALIVGGSRGLGAWVAKLIALGGGEVTITYNLGHNEAKKIRADINNHGGNCKILKMDVTKKGAIDFPNYKINQIFYFASPKIYENNNKKFNNNMYEDFYRFYVKGFDKIMKKALIKNVESIFYPSTIFIDQSDQSFREYIRAKLEGESFCKSINNTHSIVIFPPRLPKMLTDQTSSIVGTEYANIYDTILPFLIKMHKLCAN